MVKYRNIRFLHDVDSDLELILCDNSTISYPLHNHSSILTIGIVLDGTILLNRNHNDQIYSKNQTFIIPPYMPHSVKAEDSYSLLSLCIPKTLLSCINCDADKIKRGIARLLDEMSASDRISKEQNAKLLSYFQMVKDVWSSTAVSISDACIDSLKRQLELFPEDKISVEEMAQVALTSKYHFIRRFKQEVGLTPHQFQIQNRIRKAQRLMDSKSTITEVALNTGFCDQSHFIKHFEKCVGLTPSDYKLASSVIKCNTSS